MTGIECCLHVFASPDLGLAQPKRRIPTGSMHTGLEEAPGFLRMAEYLAERVRG